MERGLTIFTVGYQGLSIEDLGAIMERKGIDRIIDVRSKPFSRKSGFSRKALADAFGPRYLWKGDVLGGLGVIQDDAVDWLARQDGVLLLMCMETAPRDCHRYYELGVRLLARGVDCVHLFGSRELTTTELGAGCPIGPRADGAASW
jgi:ATP-dependent DNA helicase RecQ